MTEAAFGDAARCWCSLAARALNWRPAEFWSATPGELAMALSDPTHAGPTSAPSRELIEHMMERDGDG